VSRAKKGRSLAIYEGAIPPPKKEGRTGIPSLYANAGQPRSFPGAHASPFPVGTNTFQKLLIAGKKKEITAGPISWKGRPLEARQSGKDPLFGGEVCQKDLCEKALRRMEKALPFFRRAVPPTLCEAAPAVLLPGERSCPRALGGSPRAVVPSPGEDTRNLRSKIEVVGKLFLL